MPPIRRPPRQGSPPTPTPTRQGQQNQGQTPPTVTRFPGRGGVGGGTVAIPPYPPRPGRGAPPVSGGYPPPPAQLPAGFSLSGVNAPRVSPWAGFPKFIENAAAFFSNLGKGVPYDPSYGIGGPPVPGVPGYGKILPGVQLPGLQSARPIKGTYLLEHPPDYLRDPNTLRFSPLTAAQLRARERNRANLVRQSGTWGTGGELLEVGPLYEAAFTPEAPDIPAYTGGGGYDDYGGGGGGGGGGYDYPDRELPPWMYGLLNWRF